MASRSSSGRWRRASFWWWRERHISAWLRLFLNLLDFSDRLGLRRRVFSFDFRMRNLRWCSLDWRRRLIMGFTHWFILFRDHSVSRTRWRWCFFLSRRWYRYMFLFLITFLGLLSGHWWCWWLMSNWSIRRSSGNWRWRRCLYSWSVYITS